MGAIHPRVYTARGDFPQETRMILRQLILSEPSATAGHFRARLPETYFGTMPKASGRRGLGSAPRISPLFARPLDTLRISCSRHRHSIEFISRHRTGSIWSQGSIICNAPLGSPTAAVSRISNRALPEALVRRSDIRLIQMTTDCNTWV